MHRNLHYWFIWTLVKVTVSSLDVAVSQNRLSHTVGTRVPQTSLVGGQRFPSQGSRLAAALCYIHIGLAPEFWSMGSHHLKLFPINVVPNHM